MYVCLVKRRDDSYKEKKTVYLHRFLIKQERLRQIKERERERERGKRREGRKK